MKLNDDLTHALAECIAASENCMAQCLKIEDPKKMVDCIQANWDCSTIVASALESLAKGSKRAEAVLQECIEACKANEEISKKHSAFHCQVSADASQRCYMACEETMGIAQVA